MISKIFHVSDIHIRLYKRHREYEQVFDRLFEYIDQNKDQNSIIFLGGDIVHSKTDMSPEMIQVTSNFLRRCCDLLPTILICGNHDANLNNSHRLDALTPIVDSLKHKNLHYWRDSGLYEFDGVTFSVFSVFDGPDSWTFAKNIKSKYKIALHHGAIWDSKTDLITIQSQNRANLFDGFDLSLLGDIHVFQYLNDKKTIAYSSSLIQQNYGESLDGHGIVEWNLKTKKSKFVPIKNDFGYYTFYLVNGFGDIPENLPKNLRCRIKYENTTNDELELFVKDIGKKCKIIELIKQKESKQTTSSKAEIGNSRDVSYQNDIIEKYLTNATDITGSELDEIKLLNFETNKLLPVQRITRGVIWKPIQLKFSNMFSYSENNVIDFSNFSGINGISGANANGKSSIFEILCFVLYDKSTRAFKASHILNTSKDNFQCSLHFELNGQDFFIERIGTRQPNGNVKVDVNFWTYIDDQKVSLNGEDRDKTNYAIREYLGNYDDFVMTALSTQYDNQNFVDKSQRERKELLYKFLDINIYDDLYKIAKDASKEFQVLIREMEKEDLHSKSSILYNNIEKLERDLGVIDTHLLEERIKLKELGNQLIDLNKRYVPTNDGLDINSINNQIELSTSELESCSAQILEIKQDIDSSNNRILNLESKLVEYSSVENPTEEYRDTQAKLSDLNLKIQRIEKNLQVCYEKKKHLDNHKYDPNCKFCVENEFVKDAVDAIKKISQYEIDLKSLKLSLVEVESKEKTLLTNVEKFKVKLGLEKEYYDLKNKILNLSERKNSIVFKGKSIRSKLADLKSKRSEYKTRQTILLENAKILHDIEFVSSTIRAVEEYIEDLQSKHRVQFSNIERNRKEYEECNKKLDQYLKYIKKYRIYELYLQALSRDGVPYRILETVLPVIEHEVNNILSQLTDFSIKIEATDEKYIHSYISYNGNSSWPIELSSGMERFILSLAFRCSLSEITSLPKSNFLAIDEGFGVLDSENIMSMNKLFSYLRNQYDYLLVISHIELMRDMVDRQIVIEKVGGYSRIVL